MPLPEAAHIAVLALVAAIAFRLGRLARRRPGLAVAMARALALSLAGNELVWWAYRYSTEGFRFPGALPLQLCDLTVWATAAAAWTLNRWVFEFAFFAGLAGASMALLTPDLWTPWPSYPSAYYFIAHGLVVITVVYLTWGLRAPIARHAIWRFLAVLNGYALFLGLFNWIFHTNYMYLCRKPASASLLEFFGPWPVYLVVGEFAALGLCWLLTRLLPTANPSRPITPPQ